MNKSITNNLVAIAIILSSFLSVFGASPAPRQKGKFAIAGLKDSEVEQFFKTFQGAIDKRDKQAVAAMISYPVIVVINQRRQSFKTDASFIKNYDVLFDKRLTDFLLQTKVDDLWAKSDGVATPGGEVWFSGVAKDPQHPEKYEIKIIAVNGMTR